jgi:hypothetical protein
MIELPVLVLTASLGHESNAVVPNFIGVLVGNKPALKVVVSLNAILNLLVSITPRLSNWSLFESQTPRDCPLPCPPG